MVVFSSQTIQRPPQVFCFQPIAAIGAARAFSEVYARALDGISQFVRLLNGEERGRKEQEFQQGMSDFMHLGTNFSVFEYIFRTLRPVEGLGPEHPELVATKLLESAARLVAIIAGPQEDPLNVMEAVLTTTTEKMGAYVLELQASAGKDTSTERAVGVAKAFLKLCDSVRPDVAQMRTALRVYEKRR